MAEASRSHGQGQDGGQAAAPPGTHTHKGKKKHLLSLSEGMDLGRQQGSSLRNRCFSAFLVWPGGLPGRKKESPSRRRVNRAAAPGPGGQQSWAPGTGRAGPETAHAARRRKSRKAKPSPRSAQPFYFIPGQTRHWSFPPLGRTGMTKGQPYRATHTQHLCTFTIRTCTGDTQQPRIPGDSRAGLCPLV